MATKELLHDSDDDADWCILIENRVSIQFVWMQGGNSNTIV